MFDVVKKFEEREFWQQRKKELVEIINYKVLRSRKRIATYALSLSVHVWKKGLFRFFTNNTPTKLAQLLNTSQKIFLTNFEPSFSSTQQK